MIPSNYNAFIVANMTNVWLWWSSPTHYGILWCNELNVTCVCVCVCVRVCVCVCAYVILTSNILSELCCTMALKVERRPTSIIDSSWVRCGAPELSVLVCSWELFSINPRILKRNESQHHDEDKRIKQIVIVLAKDKHSQHPK